MSSHRPWCPPEVHANTGRLRSAGSRCQPVPRRHRYYSALRLLFPFGRRSGRPSLTAYHLATLLLRHAAAAPLPTACRRLITGPPSHRKQRWRYEASQVSGPSSSVRAAILNPAPRAAVSPTRNANATAFEVQGPLGSGKTRISWPTHAAHTLAYLRIAGRPHGPRRKARYRSAGLSFDRAGFAPAGRQTGFQDSACSLPPDQPYLVASLYCAFAPPHSSDSLT